MDALLIILFWAFNIFIQFLDFSCDLLAIKFSWIPNVFDFLSERIQSAGMMRSVRMASGRRRHSLAPSDAEISDYVMFGEPTPSVVNDNNVYNSYEELDPLWAKLEQKLSLY